MLYKYQEKKNNFQNYLKKHSVYMQETPDDGLWMVQKRLGQFWFIHPQIPNWNQDTYQEIWKDLNIIETK